jgi:hypothetical protein
MATEKETEMRHKNISRLVSVVGSLCAVSLALSAQSTDRFALTSANGIALSEFRGYDAWQLVATSHPDSASGCGTSKVGCMKAIVGNPAMVQAYREGIPLNGTVVPDGAALAKIEWLQHRDEKPYGVTVPGNQTEVSFMVKDSKRFPGTNGWGYATFVYDASADTFKPSTTDPSFARGCHACHTGGAKARDFVFTKYATR